MKTILAIYSLLAATAIMQAAVPARPNIFFIIFDDWGGSTQTSIANNSWIKTPNFDRIAREGALFPNAFTSNPKCTPCRATILTGRNTWQLNEGIIHNGFFPAGFETYPDLLEKAGYFIGLTGKGWAPGDYQTHAGRTRNPAGPLFEGRSQAVPASGINPKDYVGNFEDFLAQRPADQPFCFWMGFSEPHRGYELGSGQRAGKKLEDVTVPDYLPDTTIVRSDLLDYAIEVEWGDAQIGRALRVLEDAGLLDSTLVVVTSDHGMPFPFVKGQIHEEAFHVPLAMRWGAVLKPGRIVDDFVNLRDLAPTYMEIAGLKPHLQMTGRSLAAILYSDESGFIEGRDTMLVGKERHDIGRPNDMGYPVRALRTRDYLYVHNFFPDRWPAGNPETRFGNVDPSPTKELLILLGGYFYDLSFGKREAEELYRISDDPGNVHNLVHDPSFAPVAAELRAQMMQMLRDEGDPRAHGRGAIFDTPHYRYTGGRTKGYDTWLKTQEAAIPADLPARGFGPPPAPKSP